MRAQADAAAAASAAAASAGPSRSADARVEARSGDLLAVGTVHGERMSIRLSRIMDNAPVRDAVVAVTLRGATHPTIAETDGSYSLQSAELALPGEASVLFEVTRGGSREDLKGTLQNTRAEEQSDDKGSSRQLGWWVLNFAVCIGFLMLWSRRKKAQS